MFNLLVIILCSLGLWIIITTFIYTLKLVVLEINGNRDLYLLFICSAILNGTMIYSYYQIEEITYLSIIQFIIRIFFYIFVFTCIALLLGLLF